ncbi:MAG: T9SS type A sorting domain-containing protein [Fibromonadaceae bacterium]|jgi:hypothetical protein|nr:T9SS type A sorting domain-containing protein [Fibromonadaceae bacterium]
MKAFMFGFLFLLAAFSASFGQQMFNSCVENEGADISVTLPTSFTTANANLPDPFMMLSGSRMTTKEQWKQRRQELLKLLEKTVYGTKPPKPASVTGTVSRSEISVKVGSASFSVKVTMPSSGSAPYPLVILYDNSGANTSDFTSNGIAVANYTTSNVGGGTRASKSGAFYTVNTNNKSTGHLAAWAWGVSRIIDVIEADPNKLFDPTKIGVTGCSRDGKGAFVAGVLDQRVALTMPMESGTGGMASMRVAYNNRDQGGGTNGSQSPSSAYGEQPWLGDDFSTFQNSPNNLPIDMHEAIALVAPRGFLAIYKTAGSAGQWLNVPGSHVSAVSGAEVYKALGVGGNFGWLNTGTQSHCMWPSDYSTTVKDFSDKYLHRKKAPDTAPLFKENNRPATAASMKNWTTPDLSGSLTIGGCGDNPSPTPSSSSVGGTSSSSSSRANVSSSSSRASSSSSSRANSSSSSTVATTSSSSSDVTPDSSSSEEDSTPIISNIPLTYLSAQALNGVVEIFDIKGNKVASVNISDSQTIKLLLPSGLYFAKARGMQSVKFVVK